MLVQFSSGFGQDTAIQVQRGQSSVMLPQHLVRMPRGERSTLGPRVDAFAMIAFTQSSGVLKLRAVWRRQNHFVLARFAFAL